MANVSHTDSCISSVSHSDQQGSLIERDSPSAGKLLAMLQATLETSLIVAGLLLITLQLPHGTGEDGTRRYHELLLLLSNHIILHPKNAKYSLIGPLFSTPLWLLGRQFGHPYEWTCFYNVALFAFSLLIIYFLLRNYVDRALLRKFFLVLIYASMFVAHLSFYYGEVFTALCVGLGVLVTARRFTRVGGWIAVILGVVNTPATLVGLGLLVLKRMLDSKHLRYLLVLVAAVLCIMVESWLRRGSIFNTGYNGDHGLKTIIPYSGQSGFSYPFFFGLLSIVFSFGKGLLFFVPGLLLPIRKTLSRWSQDQKIDLYRVYTLWMCFVVGLILVYSCWWDWSGAVFWGPRYFLFASIPASFALAVRLMRYKEASLGVNLLTFVAFCLSAWVCIDGAVFQWFTINPLACPLVETLCSYTPEYSPLWMPFVFHFQIGYSFEKFLVFFLLVAAYMVAPLFIHLLKQIWDCAKQYSSEHLNWRQWRF